MIVGLTPLCESRASAPFTDDLEDDDVLDGAGTLGEGGGMTGGGIGTGTSSSLSLSSDVSRSSMAFGWDCILSKNAVGEAGAGAECNAGEITSLGICKDSRDGRPRRSARAEVGDRSDVGLSQS